MASLTFSEQTNNITSEIVKEDKTNIDILKLKNLPDSTTIAIGDTVTYRDKSNTTIFTGVVETLKEGSGGKEAEVYDNGSQLLYRNVNQLFESTTPEGIIENIINNFTSLTYVSTIVSGITIDIYKARNKRAWDIITEMSELLLANFRTDKNNNFQLEREGGAFSSKIINTSNANLVEDWKRDKTQLINSVTIEGDRQIFDENQTFNGDSSTTVFTLNEIPIDVRVTVGGVVQVGYVAGEGSGDYVVERETKKIIFDSAPATGTGNISVDYTFSFPISVRRRNKASIDTYGQHDKTFYKNYIKNRNEAREFANFILDRYKNPLLSATWVMTSNADYEDFESFVPNEIIPVTDTRTGITGNFIIKKVVRRFGANAGLFITVGDPEDDIIFWQKEVQERIKQLEERDDNSDFINEDELIEENTELQVSSSIERQLTRTLPDDMLYFAPEIGTLSAWWDLNGDALDRSGNSNDGTWSGTEAYDVGKQFDLAADFDGASSIQVDNNFVNRNTSISLYIYYDSIDNEYFYVDYVDSNNFIAIRTQNNKINIRGKFSGTLFGYTTDSNFPSGQWVHLVIIYSENGDKIYFNNVEQSKTRDDFSTVGSTGKLNIGSRDGAASFTSAKIGDLRVYPSVLDSDGISQLYNGGKGNRSNANYAQIGDGTVREYADEIEGLEGWWDLNGDALDRSGNENHGTWAGTEAYDVGKPFDLAGSFSDANTNYINFDEEIVLTEFSISIWAYINSSQPSTGANGRVALMGTPSPQNDSFVGFRIDLLEYIGEFADGTTFGTSGDVLTLDEWVNIIYTYDGTNIRIYENNVLLYTSSDVTGKTLEVSQIGKGYGSGIYFNGFMGDNRIYNRVLTDAERTRIYNSGNGIIDNAIRLDQDTGENIQVYRYYDKNRWADPDDEIPNLTALYSFEAQSAVDDSDNSYDLTWTGTEAYTTGKTGTYSADLDGSSYISLATDDFRVTEFTIMGWANITSGSNFFFGYGSSTSDRFLIGNTSNQLRVHDDIQNDSSNYTYISFSLGTWFHFAVVINSDGTKRVYLNGELVGYISSGRTLAELNTSSSVFLGSEIAGASKTTGKLDDIVLISRAVSTEEIKARYNNGNGKPEKYGSWESAN